jgi:hypothetical protein
MSWSFVKGGTTCNIQNPQRSNRENRTARQALSRAADGTPYVYSKGTARIVLEADFVALRDAEKDALQDFFDNSAEGMTYTFTLTDHEGNSWTARFLHDTLKWTQLDDQVASAGTFQVDGATGTAYPTTTREEPVWSVSVELEVTAAA